MCLHSSFVFISRLKVLFNVFSASSDNKGLTLQYLGLSCEHGSFQRRYQPQDRLGLTEELGQFCKGTLNKQRQ